jgi:hypothetical protein
LSLGLSRPIGLRRRRHGPSQRIVFTGLRALQKLVSTAKGVSNEKLVFSSSRQRCFDPQLSGLRARVLLCPCPEPIPPKRLFPPANLTQATLSIISEFKLFSFRSVQMATSRVDGCECDHKALFGLFTLDKRTIIGKSNKTPCLTEFKLTYNSDWRHRWSGGLPLSNFDPCWSRRGLHRRSARSAIRTLG